MGSEASASLPFFVFLRMKKIEKLLLYLLAFICFSACTDEYEEKDDTRLPAENTIVMFFPWSNNLKPCFLQNINDFKQVIQQHGSEQERYVVCIETQPNIVEINELKMNNGVCSEETVESYTDPGFTTSDGIADLLDRVYVKFPSKQYSMTVGCHGTGWVPAGSFATRSVMPGMEESPVTRFLGGTTTDFQIEISTFKEGIKKSKINKFEMILFDNCYMANVEVAYELRDVCKRIVAYPTEVMAYGFPYQRCGRYLIDGIDYESVCESFYVFYANYEKPCGTISTINCTALDTLARFMKKVNVAAETNRNVNIASLQRMDGYDPTVFVDFSDYVHHITNNSVWLAEFDHLMTVVVPYKRNTPSYYSTLGGQIPIAVGKCSGMTISEPSEHPAMSSYAQTSWYIATH